MISVFLFSWLGLYGSLMLESDWQPPPTAAVRHSDAARFLPATTLGAVSVVDLASLRHHLAGTQMWKLLLESQLLQEELRKAAAELRTESQDESSSRISYEELNQFLVGPLTLALLDFEPEQAKDGQPLRLALFAELSGEAEARARALLQDKILPRLVSRDGLRVEPIGAAGDAWRVSRGERLELACSVRQGRFLLVTREADLTALAQPAAQSLEEHPGFRKLQPGFHKADVSGFLDLARLQVRVLPALESRDARDVRQMLRLGFGSLGTVSYTAVPAAEGYLERFTLGYQADGKGLLPRLLDRQATVALRSIRHTPESASLVLAFHVGSVLPLYQDILEAAGQESQQEADSIRKSLADLGTELGLDAEKDLLGLLTGEFALTLRLPSVSGAVLDNPMLALGYLSDAHASVFFGVNDEKRASEVVKKLLARGEVTVTEEPHRGVSVAYLSSTQPIPVIPTFTAHDGLAGFHLNAGTARASIDAALDGKDLRQAEAYRFASAGLEGGASTSLVFVKLSEFVPTVARILKRDLERGAAEPSTEASLAAEAEKFGKRLHAAVSRSHGKPGLWVLESYSPTAGSAGASLFSMGGLLAAVVAVRPSTPPEAETVTTEAVPQEAEAGSVPEELAPAQPEAGPAHAEPAPDGPAPAEATPSP